MVTYKNDNFRSKVKGFSKVIAGHLETQISLEVLKNISCVSTANAAKKYPLYIKKMILAFCPNKFFDRVIAVTASNYKFGPIQLFSQRYCGKHFHLKL